MQNDVYNVTCTYDRKEKEPKKEKKRKKKEKKRKMAYVFSNRGLAKSVMTYPYMEYYIAIGKYKTLF